MIADEEELFYRQVFEESPIGIEIYDSDGSLIDANQACLSIFGVSSIQEVKGFKLFEDPNLPKDYKKRIQKGEAVRYTTEFDFKKVTENNLYKTSKSEKIFVEAHITPIFLPDSQSQKGFLVYVQDITERTKAEEKLQYQANLIDYVSDAVISSDLDFKILSWNTAAEVIYGFTEEEVLGKQVAELLKQEYPYDRREDVINKFNKQGVWMGEVIQKKRDGTPLNILASVSLVKDSTDTPIAALAVNRDITERKKTQEILRESEEKFRTLAEESPNMIFINKKGRVVYTNKKSEEILGYNRDEFYSSDFDFLSIIAPEYKEKILSNFRKHMKEKEVEPIGYEIITKDGERISAILTTKLIDFEGDKAILGIITDITTMQRTELELEKRTRDLRERVKELTCLYGLSSISVDRTKSLEEVVQRCLELIPPAWQYPEITCVRITIQGKKFHSPLFQETPWVLSTPIQVLGETIGSIEVFYLTHPTTQEDPFLKEEKNLINAIGLELGKFVERRQIRMALLESEERLRSTFASLDDLVFILDKNGIFSDFHQPDRQDLLVTTEEFIGRSFKDVLPEFIAKRIDTAIKEVRMSNQVQEIDYPMTVNNREFWYSAKVSLRRDIQGDFDGVTVVSRDITLRKKAEDRANFLHSVLRHDVGNKLQIIQGYLSTLTRLDLSKQEQEYVNIALNACTESMALINKIDVLEEMDQTLLDKTKEMKLIPVIKDVIDEYSDRASSLGLRINFDLPSREIKIQGGLLLREAFSNLIENTIVHSKGTILSISIKEEEGQIIVILEDNGIGVPDDIKDKIFYRGFKGKGSRGSGLGLFIVRTIVEAYEGKVIVKDSDMMGARFIVTLKKV